MALTDQQHTVRFPHPHEVVFDRNSTQYAPVYLDGAVVTVTAGTVTIYDDANNVVLLNQVTTQTGGIAAFAVPLNTFASTDVPRRLRFVWALVHSGAEVLTVENDGVVCARRLYPVITTDDIFERMPGLDPSGAAPITTHTLAQLQKFMDAAWRYILDRMTQTGLRGSWVQSPSSLRAYHLALTIAYIFGDEATRVNPAYQQIREDWQKQADDAWREMTVIQDSSGDGVPENPSKRTGPAVSSYWLGAR